MTMPIKPEVSIEAIDLRHHLVVITFGDETWQHSFRSLSAAETGARKRIAVWIKPQLGDKTVAEFAVEWRRDYVAHECTRETLKDYTACCKGLVVPHIGDTSIRNVSKSALNIFVDRLNDEGGYHSVNRGLRTLSAMLTVAESWGYIPVNPAVRRRQ